MPGGAKTNEAHQTMLANVALILQQDGSYTPYQPKGVGAAAIRDIRSFVANNTSRSSRVFGRRATLGTNRHGQPLRASMLLYDRDWPETLALFCASQSFSGTAERKVQDLIESIQRGVPADCRAAFLFVGNGFSDATIACARQAIDTSWGKICRVFASLDEVRDWLRQGGAFPGEASLALPLTTSGVAIDSVVPANVVVSESPCSPGVLLMTDDIFRDIAHFNAQYRPEPAIRPKMEDLPDGLYIFKVVAADFGRAANQSVLFKLWLLALCGPAPGAMGEKVYWLTDVPACNQLGYDLCILGFSEFATGQKNLSHALHNLPPRLRGLHFQAKKVAESGKDGKTYHKLHMLGRTANQQVPASPATPPPAAATIPPAAREPVQQQQLPLRHDDEIPF